MQPYSVRPTMSSFVKLKVQQPIIPGSTLDTYIPQSKVVSWRSPYTVFKNEKIKCDPVGYFRHKRVWRNSQSPDLFVWPFYWQNVAHEKQAQYLFQCESVISVLSSALDSLDSAPCHVCMRACVFHLLTSNIISWLQYWLDKCIC